MFRNPPKNFRGVPFWSLNDILNIDEISRQIGLMDEAGFGGVFFHAREGLVTPFLSKEWFEAFKAAVNEASRRGMYVWIYDEDRWPSGFAGGFIPAEDSRYRAKAIIMITANTAFPGSDTIAMFRCSANESNIPMKCERIFEGELNENYLYLSFVKYTASVGDVWFSGFSYVDLLDEDVVERFIDVAYRPYVELFREFIGNIVPGIFTDEPNITASRPRPPSSQKTPTRIPPRGSRFPVYALPWTDKLSQYFKKINGYDIIEKLPELFFDIGSYTKTRYDYWKTVTLMFIEAFSKKLYEWCDKHGLKFTGHYLAEDDLISQLVVGAVMPHYEYMHIPGMDHLGMRIWDMFLTAKQVSSVANQLGKERVLSETYGCTGNYPSFEDRKWIGDFLYALGINMLNHHLVPYSMRGRRKADYGLNLHWSQPWWRYNKVIEDYFTRLSYVLSLGKRVVDVLVIYPMSSIWSIYTPINDSKAREINNSFISLLRTLAKLHIDFELGDEIILSKYGKAEGDRIIIGRASYKVVIVPPSLNISSSTLKLLREFISNGGKVVAIKPIPKMVDGVESTETSNILERSKILDSISIDSISSSLADIDLTAIVKSDDVDGDVLMHVREYNNMFIVFIANVSRNNRHNVRIGINGSYTIEEWNPFTGEILEGFGALANGRTWIELTLLPIESKLLVLKPGVPKPMPRTMHRKIKEISLGGKWIANKLNPNILVLDYAKIAIDSEQWSEPIPIQKIREIAVNRGIGSRYKLRFEFYVEVKPKDEIYLVIENPKQFVSVRVNENRIDLNDIKGFWIDWNFAKYRIDTYIEEGINTIEAEGIVGFEPEIEPIYILGNFGVKAVAKGSSRIVKELYEVEPYNLCSQGYPFYSGELELIKEINLNINNFDKAYLSIEKINAALAIIYVNDVEVEKVISPSQKIDITKNLKSNTNEIKIILVGTLRNALGPLHRKDVDPPFITPNTFYTIDDTWTDEYILKPFSIEDLKIEFYKIT